MHGRYYQTKIQPTQKNCKKQTSTWLRLSKDTQAALMARHHAAAAGYATALQGVWAKLNEETRELATTYHKSINKVSNDLHMGKQLSLR